MNGFREGLPREDGPVAYTIPGTSIKQTILRSEAMALDLSLRLGAEAKFAALSPEIRILKDKVDHEFNVRILLVAPFEKYEIFGTQVAIDNYQKILEHNLEYLGDSISPSNVSEATDKRWIALHEEMLRAAANFGEQLKEILQRAKSVVESIDSQSKRREFNEAFAEYCDGINRLAQEISKKANEFYNKHSELRKEED